MNPAIDGYTLHRGYSLLPPHAPIIVVLTLGSVNMKTGPGMSQTWILLEHEHPLGATRNGKDASICGDCTHRGGTAESPRRSCYVQVAFAPSNVWRSYHRGLYPRVPPSIWSAALRGTTVRFGAYGDPLAAPAALWEALASAAKGHTGYTHGWRLERAEAYRSFLMASVDNVSEAKAAHTAGWRTFRVRDARDEALMPYEIACPASAEAGHRTHCEDCLLCDGRRADVGPYPDQRRHVAILPHGQWSVNFYKNRQQLNLLDRDGRLNATGGMLRAPSAAVLVS